MAERLPISIFSGVLPGAYIFIDDGSDDSKWINDSVVPFASITAGDLFGLYGKGIRLEWDPILGGIQKASRDILPVGNIGAKRFFGIIYRTNINSLTPAQAAIAGHIILEIKIPYSYWVDLSGGRYEMKEAIATLSDSNFYWGPATNFHSDIAFAGSQGTLIWPSSPLPLANAWRRASLMMNHLTPSLVNINGLNRIPGAALIPTATWPDNKITVQLNVPNDPGVPVYVDIDQIFISDTENRI